MQRLSVILFLLLFSTLVACSGEAEESPFSTYDRKKLSFQVYGGVPVYEGEDPNSIFYPNLLPNELRFERVVEGQEIELNSVIVIQGLQNNGRLTIEFRRSDLQKDFIRGLFFDEDTNVVSHHPFTGAGVEPILTDQRLILNIYSGVAFHLRNGMEDSHNYKTFVSDAVNGKVTKITGDVFFSSDHEYIKIKLNNFYHQKIIIQGIEPNARSKSPRHYPPRIIEGP